MAGSTIDIELQLASKYSDTNVTVTLEDVTAGELGLGHFESKRLLPVHYFYTYEKRFAN